MNTWVLLAIGIGIQMLGLLFMRRWPKLTNRTLLPIGFSIIVIAIASVIIPNIPNHYRFMASGLVAAGFSYMGTAPFNRHYTVLQSVFLVLFGFNAIASPLIRQILPQGVVGMTLYIGIIISVLICEFYLFIIASELIIKRINNDTT